MIARLEVDLTTFRPEVVYVDVLRKVTLADLNKADQAGALLAKLDGLRRQHGLLWRIVTHYRKSQGLRSGRGSQEMAHSYQLGAWGENSLFFEPVGRRQGGPVKVEVQTKDGPGVPAFCS
jgi:RecA-family ATPase